jgi:YHS domain-containing protein
MKTIKTIMMVIITSLVINALSAQEVFTNQEKVANNGYDVVNYFTSNSAERGNKEFSEVYKEAIYYFVNMEHLQMFRKDPKKYLPQFDGYCSFAVAKMNQKVPVDPKTFRIDDGKLYLFYNDFWEGKPFNTIVPWINDEAALENLAVENWKTLKNKKS